MLRSITYLIKNNYILPSKAQLLKMGMTQETYMFYKWSYYKDKKYNKYKKKDK